MSFGMERVMQCPGAKRRRRWLLLCGFGALLVLMVWVVSLSHHHQRQRCYCYPDALSGSERDPALQDPVNVLRVLRAEHASWVEEYCPMDFRRAVETWASEQRLRQGEVPFGTLNSTRTYVMSGRRASSGFADSLTGTISAFILFALNSPPGFEWVEDLATPALTFVGETKHYLDVKHTLSAHLRDHQRRRPRSSSRIFEASCTSDTESCVATLLHLKASLPPPDPNVTQVVRLVSNRGISRLFRNTQLSAMLGRAFGLATVSLSGLESAPNLFGCVSNAILLPGAEIVTRVGPPILRALLGTDVFVIACHIRWGYFASQLSSTLRLNEADMAAFLSHRDDAINGLNGITATAFKLLFDADLLCAPLVVAMRAVAEAQALLHPGRTVKFFIAADSVEVKEYLQNELGRDLTLAVPWAPVHSKDKDGDAAANDALIGAQAEWYAIGLADVIFATVSSGFSRLAVARVLPRARLVRAHSPRRFCAPSDLETLQAYLSKRFLSNETVAFPGGRAQPERLLYLRCHAVPTDFVYALGAAEHEGLGAGI